MGRVEVPAWGSSRQRAGLLRAQGREGERGRRGEGEGPGAPAGSLGVLCIMMDTAEKNIFGGNHNRFSLGTIPCGPQTKPWLPDAARMHAVMVASRTGGRGWAVRCSHILPETQPSLSRSQKITKATYTCKNKNPDLYGLQTEVTSATQGAAPRALLLMAGPSHGLRGRKKHSMFPYESSQ